MVNSAVYHFCYFQKEERLVKLISEKKGIIEKQVGMVSKFRDVGAV